MRQSRFDAGANGTCEGNLGGARCNLDPPARKAVASAIAAMFQSWLFFDLLEFILGQHVTSSYLMLEGLVGPYPRCIYNYFESNLQFQAKCMVLRTVHRTLSMRILEQYVERFTKLQDISGLQARVLGL